MLEPYQPGKIPVLMVHGIWSSPITWMEMFNDLRGAPEIRDHYQFWFYLYPSGQPFWYSAAKLREDLAEARQIIDPQHREPALDQMVLVGHSMGGLVAELQTLDSGDDFWNVVSEKPFQLVKASSETRRDLADTFFFHPNPVDPPRDHDRHAAPRQQGRQLDDPLAGQQADQAAADDRQRPQQLHKDNPDLFRKPSNLIDVDTSIDSLAPDSPILPVMLNAQRAPWVKYHNIVGRIPDKGLIGRVVGGSDGIVTFSSAHLDDVASEIVVNADHLEMTRHSLSVLEVHRILLEHLAEVDAPPGRTERSGGELRRVGGPRGRRCRQAAALVPRRGPPNFHFQPVPVGRCCPSLRRRLSSHLS